MSWRTVEETWSSVGLAELPLCNYCGSKYVFEDKTEQRKKNVPDGAKDLNLFETVHLLRFRCSKCNALYNFRAIGSCLNCWKRFKDGEAYKAAAIYENAAMNAPDMPLFLPIKNTYSESYKQEENGCTNCVLCAACKRAFLTRPIKRFYQYKIYESNGDCTDYKEWHYYHEDCANRTMEENARQQREAAAQVQMKRESAEHERLLQNKLCLFCNQPLRFLDLLAGRRVHKIC